MTRMLKVLFGFTLFLSLIGLVFSQGNLTEVGQFGAGTYVDVAVNGNYAYFATSTGLDVINIGSPDSPAKVSHFRTSGGASYVCDSGNYVYVINGIDELLIVDVSVPSAPSLTGSYQSSGVAGLSVSGNHAYLISENGKLEIIDIVTPASPVKDWEYDTGVVPNDMTVVLDYAYVTYGSTGTANGLMVIDIGNPLSPSFLGSCNTTDTPGRVEVKGNYAYVMSQGLDVIDVSNPESPVLKVHRSLGADGATVINVDMAVSTNYVYFIGRAFIFSSASTFYNDYLQVVDIVNPLDPFEQGSILVISNAANTYVRALAVSGDNTVIADGPRGMKVIETADPTNPVPVGAFNHSVIANSISVSGNYAFIGDSSNGAWAINIGTPSSPSKGDLHDAERLSDLAVGGYYLYLIRSIQSGHFNYAFMDTVNISNPLSLSGVGSTTLSGYNPRQVGVYGNRLFYSYVYTFGADFWGRIRIDDIAAPSSPAKLGEYDLTGFLIYGFAVQGNYLYAACGVGGMQIVDISDPSSPTLTGTCPCAGDAVNVAVSGDYAYVACGDGGVKVVDISDPAAPNYNSSYNTDGYAGNIFLYGDYAYVADGDAGVVVLNISDPSTPFDAADYDTPGSAKDVYVDGRYIYVADDEFGLVILEMDQSNLPPIIGLNKTQLYFGGTTSGVTGAGEPVVITNEGGGTLNWTAASDQAWIRIDPVSGTGPGTVTVSVDMSGLSPGTYIGAVTVSDPGAANASRSVGVSLTVYSPAGASSPFGDFITPDDGSTVRSSIAVTGWVLDDIGIQSVKIYRGQDYVGDALLVEGARPDVEQAYPGYPMNYRAGWGYMLLTNFLPDGDGTYVLNAVAVDMEGNSVTLGSKTVVVDNANAVKPFGAIDTPMPGNTASGGSYANHGWVLTPMPNKIPEDGSTIQLYIDGVLLNNTATYNGYRSDIAGYFPGYANSDGAAARFTVDTTAFADGVHTIHWIAADDAGNADGIGSRYFTIQNNAQSAERTRRVTYKGSQGRGRMIGDIPVDVSGVVGVLKGYRNDIEPREVYPRENGIVTVEIGELQRVVLHLSKENNSSFNYSGYLKVGNALRPLPIGSTLDKKRGIFYWQAGPGFVGNYPLVFFETDPQGNKKRKVVSIIIQGIN